MGSVDQLPQPGSPGRIDVVQEDGGPVLRLRGEIDSLAVAAWDAAAPGGQQPPVAVDASATTFLDCRGLRLLLRETEATRRAGRVPELRAPSRSVRRVLALTGTGPLFATVP